MFCHICMSPDSPDSHMKLYILQRVKACVGLCSHPFYCCPCLMRLVHHTSLLYVRVNSIILYKLQYHSIYLKFPESQQQVPLDWKYKKQRFDKPDVPSREKEEKCHFQAWKQISQKLLTVKHKEKEGVKVLVFIADEILKHLVRFFLYALEIWAAVGLNIGVRTCVE